MRNSRYLSLLLVGSILSLGYNSAASANTGQAGLNGAENGNNTGTVINNKGGLVDVDNKSIINNKQINNNKSIRKNSDDINQSQTNDQKQQSNTASNAESGSASGSNISTSEDNDTKQYTYFQPSTQTGPVGTYQRSFNLPDGEQSIVACPTKNTNFSIGSPWGGLGYGKSSDKLPDDCRGMIEAGNMRYSMYDAMRASCHLGPGYFQRFNKVLFARSMADLSGTEVKDELRMMRTANVNVAKVDPLDTYRHFCKINVTPVSNLPPITPVSSPEVPSAPTTDTKVLR